MIHCSQKHKNEAKKYFIYKEKYYPVCCLSCIKPIIKKIDNDEKIESYSLEKIKHLSKVDNKIVKDKINQSLRPKKKKIQKKSAKKKLV